MSGDVFTLRLATQRPTGGALVSLGGVDERDGVGRAHVGVGHPAADRPRWLPVGESVSVPGWGMLTVRAVTVGDRPAAELGFEPAVDP